MAQRKKPRSLRALARSIAATQRRLAAEMADLARRSRPSRHPVVWAGESEWHHEIIEANRHQLMPENALGLGLGPKLTGGQNTGIPSARVYVPRKLREPERKGFSAVPSFVKLGRRTLPVDVVRIGKPRFQGLVPGDSLGREQNLATLGAFATDALSGERVAITAMHATGLKEFPAGQASAPVFYSPSPKVMPSPQVLGSLLRGTRTEVDAALISVEREDVDVGEDIWGLRPLLPSDEGNTQVHLLGAKHRTSGMIHTIWTDFHRLPLSAVFTATYGSSEGDSGAAVIDDYGYLLGFHLGRISMGGESVALCSPAALVLDVLQCNLLHRS